MRYEEVRLDSKEIVALILDHVRTKYNCEANAVQFSYNPEKQPHLEYASVTAVYEDEE